MDYKKYKHRIKEIVKFHEVDMMGVVNNAVYFNYFEDARLDYLKTIKENYKLEKIMEGDSFFIMAHNKIDYLISAEFNNELIVFTKIEWIKKTSIGFKHIIVNEINDKTIAVGGGVMVHINLSTKQKVNLPTSFINAIEDFEDKVLKKEE